MSRSISLSVCMMTYNHAQVIEKTVKTVLAQEYKDFEFIISDDCSNDGTWEILQDLAKKDERIIVIRTPRNFGMAENANYTVNHATGNIIALLHHDDLYREDMLSKWIDVLRANPNVSFVFNSYAQEKTNFIWSHAIQGNVVEGQKFLWKHLLFSWDCPVRGTAMISRLHWDQIGGMRTEFGLLADVDLWMRLARIGNVGYVSEPLITVRSQRPDNYPDEYVTWSWSRRKVLYEIHATNIIEIRNKPGIRWLLIWLLFRIRLNFDSVKWLTYAIRYRKQQMILDSLEGETEYDFTLYRLVRKAIINVHV